MYSSGGMKRLELLLWLGGRWADLGGRPPVLCLGLFGPLCDRSEFMAIGGKTSVAKGVESAESRHRICTPSARAEGGDTWRSASSVHLGCCEAQRDGNEDERQESLGDRVGHEEEEGEGVPDCSDDGEVDGQFTIGLLQSGVVALERVCGHVVAFVKCRMGQHGRELLVEILG